MTEDELLKFPNRATQLLELKKELEKNRRDLHQHKLLIQKREYEIEKIHTLKMDVEANMIQMYRLQKIDPKKAKALQKQIEEESDKIATLKKEIKKIDAELDLLGEEKETVVDQIKQQLIWQIKTHFPEAGIEYEETESRLKNAYTDHLRLSQERQLLHPLLIIFQQGEQIRPRRKVRDFLFVRHPHAELARLIQQGIQTAETALPKIQEARFKVFLEKFLAEAKHPSNRALYTGGFAALAATFSTLMSEMEEEISQTHLEISLQEEKLEAWLDKYANGSS